MRHKFVLFLLIFIATISSLNLKAESLSIHVDSTNKEVRIDSSKWIENINATPVIEGFDVSWNIKYGAIQKLQNEGYTISIEYNTKLDAKRLEKGHSGVKWKTIDGIGIEKTKYSIKKLEGEKKYVFRIGLDNGTKTYWSDNSSVKTNQSWGIFSLLVLIGALAMFLYGMKIMSDGLQQAAGSRLRNLLGSITSSPFKGVLTGFGITALVQSSSITTVMTVSFVNAGILTLVQSAGVVMGANIGTTVTAWLVDLLGFKADIGPYTLIILAVGLPLLFMNSSRTKGWANAIIGFAFLFMGLGFLKGAVPVLGPESGIVQFFITLNGIPYLSTILFVIFGAILTIIIQSSSATIALTMTLMVSGVIPFEVGAAMVLGENIGTTITAEIAATVGNVYAKRTARIHSTFNIIGVTWVILIFPFFLKGVVFLTEVIGGGNPILHPTEYGSTGLAVLHTTFNLANVLIMIWFVPNLVRFAERTVKSKGGKDEQFQLDYIKTGNISTPHLSILEVKKEIAKFGELTSKMSGFSRELLFEDHKKTQRQLLKRIKRYEEITDKVEVEIANYLNNISSGNVDKKLAIRIRGMNSIASDLERIGDIFYQVSKAFEKKEEDKISFTPQQQDRLVEMFDLVDEAFTIMCENLKKHAVEVRLEKAREIEERINTKRDNIRREYYDSLSENGQSNIESGMLYSNIFASLERIGDHIINVTEGVMGKI